ncbi:unnamed protein product [Brassicogethes aeneus]|uniref:Hyaluronan-mediated motility receptor C-terminal domain-containing protein n=1 Tax=Brassicogethes aeneus TaxID=1431903 RepID=A0A9P0BDU9_BRAAE|nr:unnamed protein product [Brassicogethes aeneus]
MSFSKSKVKRFNEIKPVTPSPADYNTERKNKIKFAVIPKSGRFVDESPAPSENGSTKSSPPFRTPTLPKKKKFLTNSTAKMKLFGNFLTGNTNINDNEQLREKIVECDNKDLYIKELREQMDEIKDKLLKLEQEKQKMDLDRTVYEEQSIILQEEFENKSKELKEKHDEELQIINKEKEEIDNELRQIKEQCQKIKEEHKNNIIKLKENMDRFQEVYSDSIEKYNHEIEQKEETILKLQQTQQDLQNKHFEEIDRLKKEHNQELQDMEFEMLKIMTEVENKKQSVSIKMREFEDALKKQMQDLTERFIEEKQMIIIQSEDQLKQMKDNYKDVNILIEMQTKEKLEESEAIWQEKFAEQEKQSEAILKECQAISEYSIIQCELEKNIIKNELTDAVKEKTMIEEKCEEINKNYDELNVKYANLEEKLTLMVEELEETKETIEKQKEEIKEATNQKRCYQITMATCQETIEVLKKRLISSDSDVEQLKQEVMHCEEKNLEQENKLIRLKEDLKRSEEQNEELELQYESSLRMNEIEIALIKEELNGKIEEYRRKTEDFLVKTNEEWKILEDAQELVACAQIEIEHLELENEELKKREENCAEVAIKEEEIAELKKLLLQNQEKCESYSQYVDYYKMKISENESEIEELSGIRKKYIEQSGRYDDILQKFEAVKTENLKYKNKFNTEKNNYEELLKKFQELQADNENNKRLVEEQRILIGPFKEQLEAYELEKDALLGENRCIEREARDISSKYADVLGHQNQKQKIKHLHALKEKNLELLQSKMDLEKKVKIQSKTMEKLKKENEDLKKCLKKFKAPANTDKENIGSPNRSLTSMQIHSPGPLRERN